MGETVISSLLFFSQVFFNSCSFICPPVRSHHGIFHQFLCDWTLQFIWHIFYSHFHQFFFNFNGTVFLKFFNDSSQFFLFSSLIPISFSISSSFRDKLSSSYFVFLDILFYFYFFIRNPVEDVLVIPR